MNRPRNWAPLAVENRAKVSSAHKGQLDLRLGHVPDGWPYAYQWSGVSQDFKLDVSRYSVLVARVSSLKGYAHLDVDVLDQNGKPFKAIRSSTLQQPGVAVADLGTILDPAVYRVRVRLILGGPNDGCNATYNWIRAIRPADLPKLIAEPDRQSVRLDSGHGRGHGVP